MFKIFSEKIPAAVVWIVLCAILAAHSQTKRNFAVLDLRPGSGVDAGETGVLTDRLRVELFRTGKATIMERGQMDEILKEQGFQQSGLCNDAECAVQVGQMLGVDRIVSGSIGKLGSMFLVNFRVIDVQTAKIVRVVSKDISGGIEGVVGFMPDMARQLAVEEGEPEAAVTGESTELAAPDPVQPEPEPAPEKAEEPASDFVAAPQAAEIIKEAAKTDRNKNRGGVRVNTSFSGAPMEMSTRYSAEMFIQPDFMPQQFLSEDDPNYSNDYLNYSTIYFYEHELGIGLSFMIPIWKIFSIDIGPAYSYYQKSVVYTKDTTDEYYISAEQTHTDRFSVNSPAVSLGVNYCQRFSAIKLNLGFRFDVDFNILRYRDVSKYPILDLSFLSDTTFVDDMTFAPGVDFGLRVGPEFLLGKRLGLGVNYLLSRKIIITDELATSRYQGESGVPGVETRFRMPKHALQFTFAFYRK